MKDNLLDGYGVDMVMCIDVTCAMSPIIGKINEYARSIYGKFVKAMEEEGKSVCRFRIRVIGFRDFKFDAKPIVDSGKFFLLPDDNKEFECFVRVLQAEGGGDTPESSLEAIALALKSKWTNECSRQRHIILVLTDAPAHSLGCGSDSVHYPDGMPVDLAELGRWWDEGVPNGSYKPESGRLVVFAPEFYPWNEMVLWNQYWHAPCRAGSGLIDLEFEEIIDLLAGVVLS